MNSSPEEWKSKIFLLSACFSGLKSDFSYLPTWILYNIIKTYSYITVPSSGSPPLMPPFEPIFLSFGSDYMLPLKLRVYPGTGMIGIPVGCGTSDGVMITGIPLMLLFFLDWNMDICIFQHNSRFFYYIFVTIYYCIH